MDFTLNKKVCVSRVFAGTCSENRITWMEFKSSENLPPVALLMQHGNNVSVAQWAGRVKTQISQVIMDTYVCRQHLCNTVSKLSGEIRTRQAKHVLLKYDIRQLGIFYLAQVIWTLTPVLDLAFFLP